MNELLLAVPIILITNLVDLAKMLGMPKDYAVPAAFGLALVFGVIYYMSAPITETIVAILGFALSAVGLHEIGKGIRTGMVEEVK